MSFYLSRLPLSSHPIRCRRPLRPAALLQTAVALAVLVAALSVSGAAAEVYDWPEEQRAFFQDGPALLLSEAQREELRVMSEERRGAWIDDFLERDPIPETPENELTEGIQLRMELAREAFVTPLDARYQLVFLNGWPAERLEVDCGQTFHPLELWRYSPDIPASRRSIELQHEISPEEKDGLTNRRRRRSFIGWEEGPRLVVYSPAAEQSYDLWGPYEGKRALYTSDMEYIIEQYEELRNLIQGRRFDLQACPDTIEVEKATGIEGITGYIRGRPTASAIRTFLEPPDDLAAWAREAAATELRRPTPRLAAEEIEINFPARSGQLIAARFLVDVPYQPPIELNFDDEVELILKGTLESDGELFGEARVRFQVEEPEPGKKLRLALDDELRPGLGYVIRLEVENPASGAVAHLAKGFTVPREPVPEHAIPAIDSAAMVGQALAEDARAAAPDSLLLAPAMEGQVYLGLWRARALVTGERIEKVVFLVDGQPQITVSRRPFTGELRLATYPTEQIIRAEGYDADDQLVASDEVIVNQPRGSFRVGILEPGPGGVEGTETNARAEVVVPDDHKVERVEFRVNDQVVTTLEKPPWTAVVPIPPEETAYLSVVAFLDDGRQTEDVAFFHAPENLEQLDVRLVELYTTVIDRSGRPVRDLEAEDFEILEDGRSQEIVKFELVQNLPLTVGITIDTSGSMATTLIEAQKAGTAFLERVLGPRDRCFAVGFSGKPTLLMPPTDDVAACVEGLEGLISVGSTALHDAVVTSLYYQRELEGQRALILLSDGDDTASGVSFDDAVEFARRSGVVIYPVAIRVSALDVAVRRKLARLAEETGGRVFSIGEAVELDEVYAEIERELRSRYLLAYSSEQTDPGSGFREVEVKVKERGLKARTIRGYYPGQ